MPKKRTATRTLAVEFPQRQAQLAQEEKQLSEAIAASRACSFGNSGFSSLSELSDAVLASRACSLQNESGQSALLQALENSRATAAAEAEEAEALTLALEASVASSEQKVLGLGLKVAASTRSELISQAVSATLLVANASGLYACHASGPRSPDVFTATREVFAEAVAGPLSAIDTLICPAVGMAETIADAMADAGPPSSYVLKVTYQHDTRRLKTQWVSGARVHVVFANIRGAIEEGFGLPRGSTTPPAYCLKYRDDEGDLCTLVEGTVMDFLDMVSQGRCLKIRLEKHENVGEEKTTSPKLGGLDGFSMATPPVTPRGDAPATCSGTLEDDYESMWSLVDVDP